MPNLEEGPISHSENQPGSEVYFHSQLEPIMKFILLINVGTLTFICRINTSESLNARNTDILILQQIFL